MQANKIGTHMEYNRAVDGAKITNTNGFDRF